MPHVSEQQVLGALSTILEPEQKKDIVTLGMVSGLVIKEGHVSFSLDIDPVKAPQMDPLRKAAEKAVHQIPAVLSVTALLTAHHATPQKQPPSQPESQKLNLDSMRQIIAVASGKGGVGKSTTAVNLALSLSRQGLTVGLMDADIYGPSLPRMMGLSARPDSPDGKTLLPLRAHGITCMSVGLLVAEDTPMIWRGPMVQSALTQMLRDVVWGELDILVVDLPPGTGDAQLTMAQQVPLDGAVIVSTPQDIALLDVRKSINMFRKVSVPILGLVENMSVYICPNCGHEAHIFGQDGAAREAEKMGAAFLGAMPLHRDIRETSDSGTPIVVSAPDSAQAKIYNDMAQKVRHQLTAHRPQGPSISMQ